MAKSPVQIIHKKKGMKTLIKKLAFLQSWTASAGIHKAEGRRKVNKKRGGINMAKLASVLETFATWTQKKTVHKQGFDGNMVTFKEGERLSRPARIFIKLQNISPIWSEIKAFMQKQIQSYLTSTGRGYRAGGNIMKTISDFASEKQKDRIRNNETFRNSLRTVRLKGKDTPLHDTGALLNSITSKVKSDMNGKGKANRLEKKAQYIAQVDSIIKKINK